MNEAQEQAVLHHHGPMMVLAGPGSGKTYVITERTKGLIKRYQVPEENILVITFTKAAATEMKERFLRETKRKRTGVNFGTFHAVFFTILKHAYRLDYSNIIREETRNHLLKEIIKRNQVDYENEKDFMGELISEISLVKGNQMDLKNYYSSNCADEVFRTIYQEYNQSLRQRKLIDFDDMLVLTHQLLVQRSDILKLWQNKFQYILIDEFQDINQVQYEVIQMLAKPDNNLFIVGDDDQSIYRFRGARPEIMLNFPKDYPDCRQIVLDMNYRSTNNILCASNRLIQCNRKRFQKKIKAIKEAGQSVKMVSFPTLADENKLLVSEILRFQKEGIPLSEMAVLVRTNMGNGALVHKLMEFNIPFQMKDTLPNLFEHWIVRDIIAYIQISLGKTDRSLFLQIANRPKRYISRDCFDSPEVYLEDMKEYYEDKRWMLDRLEQLEYDLAMIAGMAPYAAVTYIRKGIGYEEFLKEYAQERRMQLDDLINILEELQESARDVKTYEGWFSYMEEYKEELKRQTQVKHDHTTDRVTIATMHGAKGLEFKVVFVIDVNEGIIPHKKAVLDADIEEERRLLYVAMTRAKEILYIFHTKERYNKTMMPSRFLDEIRKKQMK